MRFRWHNLLSMLAFFVVLGCAGVSEKQKKAASEQLSADNDYCFSLLNNNSNNYMQFAHCMNDASTRYFNSVKFPYPEVVYLSNSYHLALAERVEAGELTSTQATRIYIQMVRQLTYEAVQRDRAAMEQRLEWRKFVRSFNTQYLYNNPITCIQTGNIITCN